MVPQAPDGDGPRRRPVERRDGEAGAADFLESRPHAELVELVTRPELPATFERWQVVLPPGAERPVRAGAWAGALVLVERGRLEVVCRVGGPHIFEAGDLLVLGWLPLRTLRNPGRSPVQLVAVRRRGDQPPTGLLRAIRHIRGRRT